MLFRLLTKDLLSEIWALFTIFLAEVHHNSEGVLLSQQRYLTGRLQQLMPTPMVSYPPLSKEQRSSLI